MSFKNGKNAGKAKKYGRDDTKDDVIRENLSRNINWFPGHMAAAKRDIAKDLSLVDLAIELCDARIPASSRNPQMKEILHGKPSLVLMNKSSLADPARTREWEQHYKSTGQDVLFIDCISGEGIPKIAPTIRQILSEKLEKFSSKGMIGRVPRVMMIGITNVGKSTLINRLAKSARAKAEDRPGVTRQNTWVSIDGFELLDTPGILWPKFKDERVGLNLAYTGAIRDEILDVEDISARLCAELYENYPEKLCERYGIDHEDICGLENYEIFELIGRKRGFLISGGEIDYLRTAKMLITEFRAGKIGRITLERP